MKIRTPYNPIYTIEENIKSNEKEYLSTLKYWPLYQKWESLKHDFMVEVFIVLDDDMYSEKEKVELLKQKYQVVKKKCQKIYKNFIKATNECSKSK